MNRFSSLLEMLWNYVDYICRKKSRLDNQSPITLNSGVPMAGVSLQTPHYCVNA